MYENIVVQKKMIDRLYQSKPHRSFFQKFNCHGVSIITTEIAKDWREYLIDVLHQFQQESVKQYCSRNIFKDTIFFKEGGNHPPIINFIRLFAYQIMKETERKINPYTGMLRWFRCYDTFYSESTYCDNEIYEDMNVSSCMIVLENKVNGGNLMYEYKPSTEFLPSCCCPCWDLPTEENKIILFPGLVIFWDGEWRHRMADLGGKGAMSYLIVSFEYDLTK